MSTQDWSHLGWTRWISLQSKGLDLSFEMIYTEKRRLGWKEFYHIWLISFNSSVNYMPSIGSHTKNSEKNRVQSLCSWVSKYGRILPDRMRELRSVGAALYDRNWTPINELLKCPATKCLNGYLSQEAKEKWNRLLPLQLDILNLATM